MSKNFTLGIIGGGQLGSMLCQAATSLNIQTIIYCDDNDSPAQKFSTKFYHKKYDDVEALKQFANEVDVITFEFENIPVPTLKSLEKIKPVYPKPQVNYIIQDRAREKKFINDLGITTTEYKEISKKEDCINTDHLIPGILKTTTLGYDGKGQFIIQNNNDLQKITIDNNFILEKKINLKQEISVIVTRYQDGEVVLYDPFENVHKNQILDTSKIPANISDTITELSKTQAKLIAEKLDYIGTMCVEFFIDEKEKLYVNEIAPRVHNSGHLSINAHSISQFESHIRAVCNLDIKQPIILKSAMMKNIIGIEIEEYRNRTYKNNEFFYDYLKKDPKPKRKMGHLTTLKN